MKTAAKHRKQTNKANTFSMSRNNKFSKRNLFFGFFLILLIKSLTFDYKIIGVYRTNESLFTKKSSSKSQTQPELIDRRTVLKPHGEAQSPDGSFGYVYPVTTIRERKIAEIKSISASSKNFLPMSYEEYKEVCDRPAGQGFEEEGADAILFAVNVFDDSTISSLLPPLESNETSEVLNSDMARYASRVSDEETEEILRYHLEKAEENKNKTKNSMKQRNDDLVNNTDSNKKRNKKKNETKIPKAQQKSKTEIKQKSKTRQLSSHSTSPPRILCAIYTHKDRHFQIKAITDSWGWRCDGFFAASTLTDDAVGAIHLTHEGKESYSNMWQKARSTWAYIHDNYLDDFDFFYLGGDDVHLIVENLREYLWDLKDTIGESAVHEQPLYLGQHIPLDGGARYFVGGAPGYVFNRFTLKKAIEKALPNCYADATFTADDRLMSLCLEDIGILGDDTADSEGKQRFHTMDPEYVVNFNGDRGFFKRLYEYWGIKHGLKVGADIVSNQTISFHYLNTPYKMKRHHAMLYRSCPLGSKLSNSVVELETFALLKKFNITEDFLRFKLIEMQYGGDED